MTISQCLKKGFSCLEHNSQTPQLDSEVLLSFILGKDKAYLISHSEGDISSPKAEKFFKLIRKRAKGMPIAYLTGTKEFYSLPFFVDESVLIPRPETEELVDLAFAEIDKRVEVGKKAVNIVDVGTGCGNIGVSLIHKIIKQKLNAKTRFSFYLTDISGKALKIAKKNFKKLIKKHKNIRVYFVKADLLKGLKKNFDIIVSNPPYIPRKRIEFLEDSVKDFEPTVALNGGTGGIEIIKRLIKEALPKLTENGVLLFELHERHPNLVKFFLMENFSRWKAKFYKDSFGEWRFCVIKLKALNAKLKTATQS